MQSVKDKVLDGSADMFIPAPDPAVRPLLMLKFERLRLTSPTFSTWLAKFPLMFSAFGPGPTIVKSRFIASGPLVSVITPLTAKLIVSPDDALAMVCRSEPAPLSLRVSTVNVDRR